MIIKNASIYTENHTFVNGNAVVENGRFVSFSDFSEQDAQIVDARLAGVGSAKVRASESLTARVEGIGSLTYYGKPAKVTKSADGIGTVHAAE